MSRIPVLTMKNKYIVTTTIKCYVIAKSDHEAIRLFAEDFSLANIEIPDRAILVGIDIAAVELENNVDVGGDE